MNGTTSFAAIGAARRSAINAVRSFMTSDPNRSRCCVNVAVNGDAGLLPGCLPPRACSPFRRHRRLSRRCDFCLRLRYRLNDSLHRREKRLTVRHAESGARVPTFGRFVIAVVARTNVAERRRARQSIQRRIDEANAFAECFVETRDESCPKRRDRARSADCRNAIRRVGELLTVAEHAISAFLRRIAGHVGNAARNGTGWIFPLRHLYVLLVIRKWEDRTDAAARAVIRSGMPDHFFGRVSRLNARAAACE